jgi:hypothetical protein
MLQERRRTQGATLQGQANHRFACGESPAFHPQQAGGYPAKVLQEGRNDGAAVQRVYE